MNTLPCFGCLIWGLFKLYVFPQIFPGLLHVLGRTRQEHIIHVYCEHKLFLLMPVYACPVAGHRRESSGATLNVAVLRPVSTAVLVPV